MIRALTLSLAMLALGLNAAAQDTYNLDPAHSHIGFSIGHMGLTEVHGRFTSFAGTLTLQNDQLASADFTIQTGSINTDVQKRDDHLRTADFFDVEKYPTMTFVAKRIETDGDKQLLIGDFTLLGVTKELRLPVTVKGPITDPTGKVRIGINGAVTINRMDYGMTYGMDIPGVGPAVAHEVNIRLHAEAIKE